MTNFTHKTRLLRDANIINTFMFCCNIIAIPTLIGVLLNNYYAPISVQNGISIAWIVYIVLSNIIIISGYCTQIARGAQLKKYFEEYGHSITDYQYLKEFKTLYMLGIIVGSIGLIVSTLSILLSTILTLWFMEIICLFILITTIVACGMTDVFYRKLKRQEFDANYELDLINNSPMFNPNNNFATNNWKQQYQMQQPMQNNYYVPQQPYGYQQPLPQQYPMQQQGINNLQQPNCYFIPVYVDPNTNQPIPNQNIPQQFMNPQQAMNIQQPIQQVDNQTQNDQTQNQNANAN